MSTLVLSSPVEEPQRMTCRIDGMDCIECAKKIEKAVNEIFDLTPQGIIKTLDLQRPIYKETASYGHFGRDGFSWEKTDKVDAIKAKLG